MASKEFRFHYVKTPTGAISGQSVLTQTEDAINNLGDYMAAATVDATEALNKATEALNTANTAQQNSAEALPTANSALGKVNTLTTTVNSFDGRIRTAESNATNAVTTATEVSNNAVQAVTTSNSANRTAQQAVTTANAANATAADAKRIAQQAVTDTDAIREEINQGMAVITQKVTEATTQAQTNIGGPFLPLSGGTVSGTIAATGFSGPLNGNASTASKWENARKITLSGNATGAVSLDGSANATLKLTIANGSVTNAMLAAGSVTFSKVANADVATQAEAEAGTANNSFMTPLRVAQAIAAQGSSADAYVVATYHSGTSWYRAWSDGFVEQGGFSQSPFGQTITVTLIKPLTTTNYTILLGGVGGSESSVRVQPDNKTKTSFQTARYYSGSGQGSGSLYWEASGY